MNEFEKIIGYKDIKTELIRLCDVIKNPKKYKDLGVTPINGLLLDGDPGVGKTLMAKCFIKECGRKSFICHKDKPNGEFVKEIKNVFTKAVEQAPSIILLDDMDKFANEDNYHRNTDEYVTIQSCIDEIKGKDVFVIATTNGIGDLPESLLRKGRFDTIIDIETPKNDDAIEIVKYYLSQKKTIAEINAETVARLLNGQSCATLEAVINIAGQYAGYENKEMIDMDDIIRACLRVIYNAPESTTPHNPIVLERISYHEAGHTVVSEILENGSVDLVSVRTNTSEVIGGFTSFHASDDYLTSKRLMENRVIALLAGKAATEIVFGEVDTGSNNDLHRAFKIVENFCDDYCSYGFGSWTERNSSNSLIARKEDRVIADMENYYAKAKKIIIENRIFLDEIAKRLQEKDTIVSSEIKKIKEDTTKKREKLNTIN